MYVGHALHPLVHQKSTRIMMSMYLSRGTGPERYGNYCEEYINMAI